MRGSAPTAHNWNENHRLHLLLFFRQADLCVQSASSPLFDANLLDQTRLMMTFFSHSLHELCFDTAVFFCLSQGNNDSSLILMKSAKVDVKKELCEPILLQNKKKKICVFILSFLYIVCFGSYCQCCCLGATCETNKKVTSRLCCTKCDK